MIRMFGCARDGQLTGCIQWYAREVRNEIGRLFDVDPVKGWKRAKREGCRVVPVLVATEKSLNRRLDHLYKNVSPVTADWIRDA